MTRLVRLEPPYTRGAGSDNARPVLRGPRLARSRDGNRWHRPRSGVQYPAIGALGVRVAFSFWCGGTGHASRLLTCLEVPKGEPLCGTCEGRAIGAGHPPIGVEVKVALLFEPVSQKPPPPSCPASLPRALVDGRWLSAQRGVFSCPACGEPTRLRAAGRPYDSHEKIEGHAPGPDLIDPCPFHRWDSVAIQADGSATCGMCRSGERSAA